MDDETKCFINKATRYTISTITLITVTWFLIGFIKLKEKTLFYSMIFVLCISESVFAISTMLACYFESGSYIFWTIMVIGSSRFGLYWSCFLSIFTYKIMIKYTTPITKSFIAWGFVTCSTLAFLYGHLLYNNFLGMYVENTPGGTIMNGAPGIGLGEKFLGWLFFYGILLFGVILVIVNFYGRIYQALRDNRYIPKHVRTRVLVYVFIPVICLGPWIAADTIVFFLYESDEYPFGVQIVFSSLRRLWGVSNLLAFWFFNPSRGGGGQPLKKSGTQSAQSLKSSMLEENSQSATREYSVLLLDCESKGVLIFSLVMFITRVFFVCC